MILIEEELEAVFHKLFATEGVLVEDYRVSANRTLGCNSVEVLWDGFEGMSVTARQEWIWERLRGLLSVELRPHLSLVVLRTFTEGWSES
jgi:hypothetical protein